LEKENLEKVSLEIECLEHEKLEKERLENEVLEREWRLRKKKENNGRGLWTRRRSATSQQRDGAPSCHMPKEDQQGSVRT